MDPHEASAVATWAQPRVPGAQPLTPCPSSHTYQSMAGNFVVRHEGYNPSTSRDLS